MLEMNRRHAWSIGCIGNLVSEGEDMPEETENQRVFRQTDIKFSLMDMLATAQKSKFILRGIISSLHDMKQPVYLQSCCYKKKDT